MNYHDFIARLANMDVSFHPERDARSTFGGHSVDFVIQSYDDWPDRYTVAEEDRKTFPKFISRSSLTLKGDHDGVGSALRRALDDEYDDISVDDIDLYTDEMVLHVPPYRKDQQELLEEYVPTEDEPLEWVNGQRIGFGPVEPEWGIVPHLYLHDDETISPEKTIQVVRQCVNLVSSERPMTAQEIVERKP